MIFLIIMCQLLFFSVVVIIIFTDRRMDVTDKLYYSKPPSTLFIGIRSYQKPLQTNYGLFLREICTKTDILNQIIKKMDREFCFYCELYIHLNALNKSISKKFRHLQACDKCDLVAILNSQYRQKNYSSSLIVSSIDIARNLCPGNVNSIIESISFCRENNKTESRVSCDANK